MTLRWNWDERIGGESEAGAAPTKAPDEVVASDSPAWDGTNTSGFSGLAGGYRYTMGTSTMRATSGYFWSASADGRRLEP